MGEYAEMMLEGLVCECCGEFLGDDEGPGFPRVCPGCQQPEPPPKVERPNRKARSR
jgi:hypothetical protein